MIHRNTEAQDRLHRRSMEMLSGLHPAFWAAAEWQIGRTFRRDIVATRDSAGNRIYGEYPPLLYGLPVTWADGDEMRLMVDPARYLRSMDAAMVDLPRREPKVGSN